MTAVWILLFVCTSSLPSCSQGDVSVANQSYTSSEECYADGAKLHWNMTPPLTSPTSQRQKWRAGFACEGADGLHGAYMACDKFADHLFRIARPKIRGD